jgi:hypothetical protein
MHWSLMVIANMDTLRYESSECAIVAFHIDNANAHSADLLKEKMTHFFITDMQNKEKEVSRLRTIFILLIIANQQPCL